MTTTYTGVKQSGMPDASGSGNPLSSSGLVSLLQATTTASYNAWAVLIGAPSTAGTATGGAGTTIRQQQSGELHYADFGGLVDHTTDLRLFTPHWNPRHPSHSDAQRRIAIQLLFGAS